MFAPKDLSSLNMLGKNLGDAVQNQFRNDLQAAKMEREQQKNQGIQSSLSLFSKAINDPNLKPEQKQQAKIGTMNSLIGLGADPKYIDLVGEMLPERKPVGLQFNRGGAGEQPIIFDPSTGAVTPAGNVNPVKPEWKPTGKTIHEDGIVKKEMGAFDGNGNAIPGAKPRYEPWQREDDWVEKFNAMLDARGLVEVKKRTKELINKARPLEQKSRYFQDLLDTKTVGLIGKDVKEEEIAQERERIQALKNSVDGELVGYRNELGDIEKDYGSEMINNPSGKNAGNQQPTVEPQKQPPAQKKPKPNVPTKNDKGWVLSYDAESDTYGYVNQSDPTQFEEVK